MSNLKAEERDWANMWTTRKHTALVILGKFYSKVELSEVWKWVAILSWSSSTVLSLISSLNSAYLTTAQPWKYAVDGELKVLLFHVNFIVINGDSGGTSFRNREQGRESWKNTWHVSSVRSTVVLASFSRCYQPYFCFQINCQYFWGLTFDWE